ncbi:MAG: hypothetical protein ACOCYP_08335 [Planctomycetota bacterium]
MARAPTIAFHLVSLDGSSLALEPPREQGRFVDAGIDAERTMPATIDMPPQHLLMELARHCDEARRT